MRQRGWRNTYEAPGTDCGVVWCGAVQSALDKMYAAKLVRTVLYSKFPKWKEEIGEEF